MSWGYTVYGASGSGSMPVEATLTLMKQPFRVVEAATWENEAERDKVAGVNPMRQVPALITPPDADGSVETITESAAILLWLTERHPDANLAPRIDDPRRAQFLRWMTFIPASIYSMFWVRDVPSRLVGDDAATQAVLLARTADRIADCWAVMESQLTPGRFLLGDDLTVRRRSADGPRAGGGSPRSRRVWPRWCGGSTSCPSWRPSGRSAGRSSRTRNAEMTAHRYDWPRPSVTTDVVLLAERDAGLSVLLIRRKGEPFAGRWALPGGFLDEGETLQACAARELKEETGLVAPDLTLVGAYGDPGRDPRGWTVSIAFRARVGAEDVAPVAGDDAAEVGWFPVDALPDLAFDHARITADAVATA